MQLQYAQHVLLDFPIFHLLNPPPPTPSPASVLVGTPLPIKMIRRATRIGSILVLAAFAANWAAKLIWLGM